MSSLLEAALCADFGPAMLVLAAGLETLRDVTHLRTALPPLVQVLHYGNVCRTDIRQVIQVAQQLVPRLYTGLRWLRP